MEERFGVRGTSCAGVFFAESDIPGARALGPVQVEISRQNSNLEQVKQQMAVQARQLGANAIANFTYGQKPHAWWELFTFKWDTESWHGAGHAVLAH